MPQQPTEGGGLLGVLSPGRRKLEGKTFYLDNVKRRPAALLVEAISLLGGRVESFLHKDVSFVVTGSQEALKDARCVAPKTESAGMSGEAHHPVKQKEGVLGGHDRQRPATPRPMGCGSRGKALLEKAIRNNERLQGSSVLSNARSWGVKILLVDDVFLFLQRLTRESFSARHKRTEQRSSTKCQAARVVKAVALRSPYLKVEDLSRKYKPLHMQSMTFPTLCYLGRFSPFEPPPPPRPEKLAEQGENQAGEMNKPGSSIQDKPETPLGNPSPWRVRKKDRGYCECCRQPYSNQEEHVKSEQHYRFVLDPSNYSILDQLVAEMQPEFNLSPSQQSEAVPDSLHTIPLIQVPSPPELEPLTDTETEHAVKALLTQGSSFNTQVPSPVTKPVSPCPATPPPEVQPSNPNQASPLADGQPLTPSADCQLSDSQPVSPRPATPSPDVLPLISSPAIQLPDTQHLSSCLDRLCPSPDPYSLLPVLSPQVPDLEPHSPYSEPPVLSPQTPLHCPSPTQYTAEEDFEALGPETKTVEIVSESVPAVLLPISTPLVPPAGLNHAEGVLGSNQEGCLSGVCGLMYSNKSLECTRLAPHRSRSLPRQQSRNMPNPKKRCRSASPEHSPKKRRRMSLAFGHSACWTEREREVFAKPENEIMTKAEACLFSDKLACQTPICQSTDCIPMVEQVYVNRESAIQDLKTLSTCTVEKPSAKQQTHATFRVPNVQNLPQVPNRIDSSSGPYSTSVTDQVSWPAPSNTRTPDPPLCSSNNKSHSAQYSQDSHPFLPHSISSICIESALVPDMAALSPSSSESDWDCELLSRLGPGPAISLPATGGSCGLDQELLQRPCTWMHDTSYESRLHSVLQPATPTASLCGEEMDPSAFSRTVVQIVEVQH